jgi:hypothetical protein
MHPDDVHPNTFWRKAKFDKSKYSDFIEKYNKKESKAETKARVQKLLEKEREKRETLKALGYEFPGFQALIK